MGDVCGEAFGRRCWKILLTVTLTPPAGQKEKCLGLRSTEILAPHSARGNRIYRTSIQSMERTSRMLRLASPTGIGLVTTL
ncbi:hypothetical protein JZ751_017540 [Albula glossodonta]|uniref:Uncharacterized protein n=1 Tax=Albula glossodonta TaxID=121402 RepID=A0A8T2PK54_9TELE|nr:hypothetical protein JZ751_017540 [Albula glossodonta]